MPITIPFGLAPPTEEQTNLLSKIALNLGLEELKPQKKGSTYYLEIPSELTVSRPNTTSLEEYLVCYKNIEVIRVWHKSAFYDPFVRFEINEAVANTPLEELEALNAKEEKLNAEIALLRKDYRQLRQRFQLISTLNQNQRFLKMFQALSSKLNDCFTDLPNKVNNTLNSLNDETTVKKSRPLIETFNKDLQVIEKSFLQDGPLQGVLDKSFKQISNERRAEGHLENLCKAIREAIFDYIAQTYTPNNIQKLDRAASQRRIDNIDSLLTILEDPAIQNVKDFKEALANWEKTVQRGPLGRSALCTAVFTAVGLPDPQRRAFALFFKSQKPKHQEFLSNKKIEDATHSGTWMTVTSGQ